MNKRTEAIAYCNLQPRFSSKRLLARYLKLSPGAGKAIARSSTISKQIEIYEAAALYSLMSQYNKKGNTILEIGSAAGYSASIIAQAAPLAKIITLEASDNRSRRARKNLVPFANIEVREGISWEVLAGYTGPLLAAIFVDGDHLHASRDIPWYNWLKEGGLILFHDYTPIGSWPVVAAIQTMADQFGRRPDVEILEERGIGMAGFYRKEDSCLLGL